MAFTPINPAEKSAVLDIIKEKNCPAAREVYQRLNYYEDLPKLLLKYIKSFDVDFTYLHELLTVIDASLMAPHKLFYKPDGPISNAKIVVKALAGTIVTIDSGLLHRDLEIVGESLVDEVRVINNSVVDNLTIAAKSKVTLLTIAPGSCVNYITIRSEDATNKSELTKIDGNCIREMNQDTFSVFNGVVCYPATT